MANIKISELNSATSFGDSDLAMIVQSGENKKITKIDLTQNVYSTSETVIGKYGNKKVYRKLITSLLPNATAKNVAHNISGIVELIDIYGWADNGNAKIPINFVNAVSSGSMVSAYVEGSNIVLGCSFDGRTYSAYIILEYTKSGD